MINILIEKGLSKLLYDCNYFKEIYIEHNVTCNKRKKVLMEILSQMEGLLEFKIACIEFEVTFIEQYLTHIATLEKYIKKNKKLLADCDSTKEFLTYVDRDIKAYINIKSFHEEKTNGSLPNKTIAKVRFVYQFYKYVVTDRIKTYYILIISELLIQGMYSPIKQKIGLLLGLLVAYNFIMILLD